MKRILIIFFVLQHFYCHAQAVLDSLVLKPNTIIISADTLFLKTGTVIVKADTIHLPYKYGEIEMYDFISTQNGTKSVTMIEDSGWKVVKGKMWQGFNGTTYAICNDYSPARQFLRISKMFHGNGMIWRRGVSMTNAGFDILEEFDENGKLIKYFDKSQELGRITPRVVVTILEKEGWFNSETGEQKIIPDIDRLPTNGEFTYQLFDPFYMQLYKPMCNHYWSVLVKLRATPLTKFVYNIDCNTGEFTKENQVLFPSD